MVHLSARLLLRTILIVRSTVNGHERHVTANGDNHVGMGSTDPPHDATGDAGNDKGRPETAVGHTSDVRGESTPGDLRLTNLDTPLLADDDATKRDLIEYLTAAAEHLLPELVDRPLSVIRVPRDGRRFMQKNVSAAPEFVRTATFRSDSARGHTTYAVCDDERTLLWLGNLRAIELHPALVTVTRPDHMNHLVLDIDPPSGDHFAQAAETALLVRAVLDDVGLRGVVKTSGAKGVHVFVPVGPRVTLTESVAATRAIAARAARLDPTLATTEFKKADRVGRVFIDATRFGSGTVVAAFSPRARPGLPVSFPVTWDDLPEVSPGDFTIHSAIDHLTSDAATPWLESVEVNRSIPSELLAEGLDLVTGPVHGMEPVRT